MFITPVRMRVHHAHPPLRLLRRQQIIETIVCVQSQLAPTSGERGRGAL